MADTYTLISSVTVGAGGASSIDFTSIPSTYTDLKLVLSSRDTQALTDNYINMTFNADSGANYSNRILSNIGASATSASFSAQNQNYLFQDNGDNSTANTFSNIEMYIPNYAGSTQKSYSNDGTAESNTANPTGTRWSALNAGLWSGTAAINRITLTPGNSATWKQYSTAYLYGIKNS